MKYCDDCKHLFITENQQQILEQKNNRNLLKHPLGHMCMLLNKRVLHKGHHPRLPQLDDCPLEKEMHNSL